MSLTNPDGLCAGFFPAISSDYILSFYFICILSEAFFKIILSSLSLFLAYNSQILF